AKFLNVPHIPRGRPRIDWPGAITLAVGLVPLLIVAEQGRTWGWASTNSIVSYVIGGVGLILFVLCERWYGDDALLPLRLFRNSVFSLVTVVGIIVGMGMFGGIAVLPQFLQIVRGASPIQSGFLMLPLVAGIMVASITSGQLTSRTGRYKVFPVVGTLLMTAALVIMSMRINVDIPFWELDLYMAMFGLGLGCCMQTLILAAQNASPARDMGVVTASSTFFRQLGGTIGTAVFFSILFSTLPDKIKGALGSAAQSDTAFQAAVADPAVQANAANKPFFALAQSTGGSGSNVLSDSAFLQTIDARLARPILIGFSDSITLVLLVAACVIAVAFLLVLFVREMPLRTMSGAQAAAMEEAARNGEVPATVAVEALPTAATANAPSPDVAGPDVATPAPPNGRHALALTNGNGAAASNGNGHSADLGVSAVPLSGPGIVGTVRRVDGQILPRIMVTVADPAGHQEARTGTDGGGRYAVALRAEGTYLVVAAAGTYQPQAALVGVGPDTPARHDITMSGTSAVFGVVRNGTDPVGGAAVTLIDSHGDVAAAGVADGVGRYQLGGVPDGAYTLTAASAGHQPVAATVWLENGATIERNLDLPQRSRLVGTVTAAGSGHPVDQATATLVDAGGTVVASTVTGADGGFAFDDLAAGTYTLTARGYAPVAQTVHVTAGVQATADVSLGSVAVARPVEAHCGVGPPVGASGPAVTGPSEAEVEGAGQHAFQRQQPFLGGTAAAEAAQSVSRQHPVTRNHHGQRVRPHDRSDAPRGRVRAAQLAAGGQLPVGHGVAEADGRVKRLQHPALRAVRERPVQRQVEHPPLPRQVLVELRHRGDRPGDGREPEALRGLRRRLGVVAEHHEREPVIRRADRQRPDRSRRGHHRPRELHTSSLPARRVRTAGR
ncbi:MAG: hypothetical protein QOH17_1537, partial [Pseudonocardiales bacterium]|nr:hypothetical protein [Pseudonocardiales bacterium]